jgi:hypothetical protein
MTDKLGGELKSDSKIDGLTSLFAIIFIVVAMLNFAIPIRFWLTMLYWTVLCFSMTNCV